jgi:N-acetyl-anhydromuramyl-L-alanine amidase AmpD
MQFVEANSFRQANRTSIDRIVIHTAQIQEHRDSAEDVASFFSNPSTNVSAHYCIDNNTIVQCVRDEDIAFHAFGDNDSTLGFELSGFAGQTHEQWRDPYSDMVVERAAKLAAEKCKKYGIPVRWLTPDQERRRRKGFVTHKIVSDVWGDSIRSDPGPHFPYGKFLNRVEFHLERLNKAKRWRINFATREKNKDGDWVRRDAETKHVSTWFVSHPGALQRGVVHVRPIRED